MKQNYELTYLISGNLPNEAALAVSQKVGEAVQQAEGFLSESRLAQRINLAYPVSKETTAFLQTTYFSAEPEVLAVVEKKLKEINQVLRFLLVKKIEPRKLPARRVPRRPQIAPKISPVESTTASPKVELGEIEKKLDEILK